jgi:RimJ/RimL family protein N-acetyltransferase
MELHARACVVRTYRPDDAPSLARHGNDRRIWLNLRDRFPHPYTVQHGEGYVAYVLAQQTPTGFAIAVDGEAVGGISLHPGTDIERIGAEVGYWLGAEHWGRGIATAAVELLTAHALGPLGFRRVFALPFTRNVASARVLEKAGFAREGTLRQCAIKNDVVVDMHVYARLAQVDG